MRFSSLTRILLLCSIATVLFACARRAPPPPPEETEPQYYEHIVMFPGETMGLISRWYTGTADNWKEIITYNPGLNVYRMRKGDLVKIPDFLLKRRQAMPRTYVEKFYAGAAREPQKPDSEKQPAEKKPSSSSKTEERKVVSPEEALPSVTRETPTAPEQSPPSVPAPEAVVAPQTAAPVSAPGSADIDKPQAAPQAAATAEPAPAAPRAKTREELLRELLDEGAEAPK